MPARKPVERDDAALSEDDLAGAQAVQRKITKPRVPAKATTKRKAPTKQSRPALADRTNMQTASDRDEDDLDRPKAKRTKTADIKRQPAAMSNAREHVKSTVPTIQESQEELPGVDEIEQTMDNIAELAPAVKRIHDYPSVSLAATARLGLPHARSRSASVQPGHVPARDRSASLSGTEYERRGGDPETRRQLVAMTRKCENLSLKNEALEDLVRSKADSNFDKLKSAADEKTRQADELIAALKKEISTLRKSHSSTSTESKSLREQLTVLTEACEASRQENSKLEQELTASKQSLQSAENERKALQAKLDVARQQTTEEPKNGSRSVGVKQTEAQKEAKMKENLYADLTGLLIRGIKRKDGEDEYDCLQTGRNGSLHFHLSIANDTGSSNPKTPGASYDGVEFYYEPFLEESRDRSLLEILPDYLSEDICFPRNHAVKFYSKVVESMTKRIVIEDE